MYIVQCACSLGRHDICSSWEYVIVFEDLPNKKHSKQKTFGIFPKQLIPFNFRLKTSAKFKMLGQHKVLKKVEKTMDSETVRIPHSITKRNELGNTIFGIIFFNIPRVMDFLLFQCKKSERVQVNPKRSIQLILTQLLINYRAHFLSIHNLLFNEFTGISKLRVHIVQHRK